MLSRIHIRSFPIHGLLLFTVCRVCPTAPTSNKGMQIITYLSVLLLILLTLHLWLRRVCRLPRRPTILSLELEGVKRLKSVP